MRRSSQILASIALACAMLPAVASAWLRDRTGPS